MRKIVKKSNGIIISFLIVLTILLMLSPAYLHMEESIFEEDDSEELEKVNLKISLDPKINIVGDIDLANQADYGLGTISEPYVIENKTIDGGAGSCIHLENTTKPVIIRNCTLINGFISLQLTNVTNAMVTNNSVSNASQSGIHLFKCFNNTIYKNKAFNNSIIGIYIRFSNYTNVTENQAYNNPTWAVFISSSHNNTIFNNTINYNRDGIYLSNSNENNVTWNVLYYNEYAITEIGCFGNVIENNDIKYAAGAKIRIVGDSELSVWADYGSGTREDPYFIENKTIDGLGDSCIKITNITKHLVIRNTTCNNGGFGIYLTNVSNALIINNTISMNDAMGIYIKESFNNTVQNNTLSHNDVYGAGIYNSTFINVSYNVMNNNDYHGICLYGSHNNTIFNNTINNNDRYGIILIDATQNNITWNTIIGNLYGIGEDTESLGNNLIENNNVQNRDPPSNSGDDDDDDDSADDDEDNYITILIIGIIIASISAVAAISIYHRRQNATYKRIIKERYSSKEVPSKFKSSKEIALEGRNKKNLLQIFDENTKPEKLSQLENIKLTVLSEEFLRKLDSIKIDESEKGDFIKEMLKLSPKERNEILESIYKKLN